MKFWDMPYQRPNEKELQINLEKGIEDLKKAKSSQEQIKLIKEIEGILNTYRTFENICYIRHSINTKDTFYEKEQEFFDSFNPVLSEKYDLFNKALISSPFRPRLEEAMGKVVFKNAEMEIKGFSPKIIPLMQEENTLVSEYQKLYAGAKIPFDGGVYTIAQLGKLKKDKNRDIRKRAMEAEGKFFDDNREKFDEIYDKLVKNRTRQATELGFSNFVELGYIRQQRNCYDINGVANFRKQVLSDLVPLVSKMKEHQKKRIGIDSLMLYDDSFHFSDGDPTPKGTGKELLSRAIEMYKEMSPETKEFISMMEDMELFDLEAKEGKAPGGYCISIPDYKCPFIFSNFNGTDGDVDVLTHEAGHAFADFTATKLLEFSSSYHPSMEGCETHSMSMEFLTSPWHNLFFKEDTDKYELMHAENTLSFIPYGTEVDYFQQLVYENPNWTPEERNKAWAKLEKQFRPWINLEEIPFYARGAGWQRQLHIYHYPFYYLDYCLAQTVALQIFAIMLEDSKKAWKTYLGFVSMGGMKFFTELCRENGLVCPIDDGCLKFTCEKIGSWIESKQKKF